MQQVKDCLSAAQEGIEWQRDGGGPERGGGEDDQLQLEPGSRPALSGPAALLADMEAQRAAAEGGGGGEETADHAAGGTPFLTRGRISLLGAIIAWVGIVGMFLSVLPRLYQRRRTSVPDHSPSKLSV
jgi:hypothetical protein